jgi:hypothetical protein
MWCLYFRKAGELVGVAFIVAPTLYHARLRAVIREIGKVDDYSSGQEVDPERAAMVPKDHIGRLLSPEEAADLIARIERTS